MKVLWFEVSVPGRYLGDGAIIGGWQDSLEDIVRELNRSYDVRIRIADESLKHVPFYATFNRKEQSISKVLGILTATHQIYYTEEGDEILLYKNTGKKK